MRIIQINNIHTPLALFGGKSMVERINELNLKNKDLSYYIVRSKDGIDFKSCKKDEILILTEDERVLYPNL